MKPNTPIVIPISQVTSFLCHPGARLGHFQDPPCPSVAVEGGWFEGDMYDGVVLTPAAPAVGTTRVDLVVANPATGDIELVEGTEGSGSPPTLPASSAAAPIADVWVVSRTNSEILIEAVDIKDRRSVIAKPKPSVQTVLAYEGFMHLGHRNNTQDQTPILKAGDTSGPFACKKSWVNRINKGLSFDYGRSTAVEVQLIDDEQWTGKPATDFFMVVQLYGSVLQAGTRDGHTAFSGVTWKRLTRGEYTGNAAFTIEVIASPFNGGADGAAVVWAARYLNPDERPAESKNVMLHVQLWQRITS